MDVNGDQKLYVYQHSLKYLLLCSAEERNSYRFGITSLNDDKSLFFQVKYPFKYHAILIKIYIYCM